MASREPAHTVSSSALTSGQSHTPGPWEVGQHPAMSRGWIVRPALFGPRVMVLPEWDGGHVVLKSEADARLIAASPDLLAAAKRALNVLKAQGESIQPKNVLGALDAAIRKAEAS